MRYIVDFNTLISGLLNFFIPFSKKIVVIVENSLQPP
jgi:hypothetical protein